MNDINDINYTTLTDDNYADVIKLLAENIKDILDEAVMDITFEEALEQAMDETLGWYEYQATIVAHAILNGIIYFNDLSNPDNADDVYEMVRDDVKDTLKELQTK